MNPENYNRHLEQVEEGDASAQESGYAWFRMMAEQGYANAQFITAMCLRDGIGTEPDGEQALEWLERSAAQGYHEAQFLLGVYHLHGGMDGVEEDEAEGLRLLELAVEHLPFLSSRSTAFPMTFTVVWTLPPCWLWRTAA